MNRRAFFGVTAGALASAVGLRLSPCVWWTPVLKPEPPKCGPITWHGVPITYNRDCPSDRIYFLSKNGPYVLGTDNVLTAMGVYVP